MELGALGRLLIVLGLLVVLAGLVLLLTDRLPFVGRLPGDFSFRVGGVRVFIPLATMLIVSLLLTLVLNLISRWLR